MHKRPRYTAKHELARRAVAAVNIAHGKTPKFIFSLRPKKEYGWRPPVPSLQHKTGAQFEYGRRTKHSPAYD